MVRFLFLVLFTGSLAGDYFVSGREVEEAASVPFHRIHIRGLNLRPSKYGSSQNKETAPPSSGSEKPSLPLTSINTPPTVVSEIIETRITSCQTSDGSAGSCVKENQCKSTNDEDQAVFQIDVRQKEFQESPCLDSSEICCTPSGIITPGSEEIAEPGGVPVTEDNPAEREVQPAPVQVPVTHRGRANCGIRNLNGVGTRTNGSGDENKAKFGEFPWTVQLLDKNRNNAHLCGGALLHPQVVITAAHCLLPAEDGGKIPDLLVRAGEWDRSSTSEELPYQDRDVISNVPHDYFEEVGLFFDIALLHLKEPFEMTKNLGVVCLPLQMEDPEHLTPCVASGWGKESNDQELQDILKKVELPIVENIGCTKWLRKTRLGNHYKVHDHFLCAGGDGRDTCDGDGGSPLVCPMPEHPDRYTLTGITSWGVGCNGKSIPGLYTHVPKLVNWITSIIDLDFGLELTGYQFIFDKQD